MKKNKLFIVGCCALVFFLSACAKREIKNLDSQGRNIICFGDSITYGYGAQAGEDYPAALAKLVKFPVLNKGIDGDTTSEALKRLNSDVLDRQPLIVVIEFSGNDFLRKIPKEVTVDNIREMVRRCQAKGAIVAVADISAGMFLKEYRRLLSRVAREEGAIFIPSILGGIITNPSMKSDFLHPNARGYSIIAERIHRVLVPYLEKNSLLRAGGEAKK